MKSDKDVTKIKRVTFFLRHSVVIKVVYQHSLYEPVISKACRLAAHIRKSPSLVHNLMSRCGKSVLMDCSTRWNSTNSMIKHHIELKASANDIMTEASEDTLLASEWSKLDEIVSSLEAFANHTDSLQSDMQSLSNVIPALMDLVCHLEQFEKAKSLTKFWCVLCIMY